MRGIQMGKVERLRGGRRASSVDEFRLFVQRHVLEQVRVSAELQEAARLELSAGGYWSAEAVANRILGFAQAMAGGDRERLKGALEAVRRGFSAAERILGRLAPVSDETRRLVEERLALLVGA